MFIIQSPPLPPSPTFTVRSTFQQNNNGLIFQAHCPKGYDTNWFPTLIIKFGEIGYYEKIDYYLRETKCIKENDGNQRQTQDKKRK